jgi:predicted acyltransferase
LTTGLDLILLAALVYRIDIRQERTGNWFFEVAGKNPLAIYLFSDLFATTLSIITLKSGTSLYEWIYINCFSFLGPYYGSLAFALGFMGICWGIGYWMDRKKIYLRV